MIKSIKDIRNTFDFFLRNRIKVGFDVPFDAPTPRLDENFQRESAEFLDSFPWGELFSRFSSDKILNIADIGARNFCLAPTLDNLCASFGYNAEIHGIEMDAYRRLTNFRTRKNYGDFYANKIRKGDYHVMDFLHWKKPLHVGFLLNPFVSDSPILAWGLPLSKLQPNAIFKHLYELLVPQNGFALVSSPSEDEFEIVKQIAKDSGFTLKHSTLWTPDDSCVQKKPRYGVIVDTGVL